jgi:hypothetical protein
MNIDFDDAGIRGHLDDVQARIGRRLVAFHMHRHVELGGGRFNHREELEIVFQSLDRRHEHAEPPIARLDRERGAHGDGRSRR